MSVLVSLFTTDVRLSLSVCRIVIPLSSVSYSNAQRKLIPTLTFSAKGSKGMEPHFADEVGGGAAGVVVPVPAFADVQHHTVFTLWTRVVVRLACRPVREDHGFALRQPRKLSLREDVSGGDPHRVSS